MQINIGNSKIGDGFPCFIIAEAGVNHNGNLDIAKRLIDAACDAGADAVKFQIFSAEKMATDDAEQAEYQLKNTGIKESQYDMLKKLELGYDDFRELKNYCDKRNIIFLSTPHSCIEDVDFVAEFCPAIKVGSDNLTNIPFLTYIAGKGLPVILSTGMATLEEIKEAVEAISFLNKQLILLHATTDYPTPLGDVNLCAMSNMGKEFDVPVGYSDHTIGINVSVAAVVIGACIIEKHFTLDRTMKGPDHKASLEPNELRDMVREIRSVEKRIKNGMSRDGILDKLGVGGALGDGIKRPTESEKKTMKVGRKSIFASVDIAKGNIITETSLAIKRPETGLKPKYYRDVIGKYAKVDIKRNEPITFDKLV